MSLTPDAITGHHAPLFTNPADPKKISADRSVREYEQAGVPAAKIVLGVPFYGHVWGDVTDVDRGLFHPGKPVPNAFASYGNISATMLNHGFIRYWDPVASAPYLYNSETKIFVSYEDPESLALKCRYVRDHKLGGVMFWEYAGDPTGALLDTIDTDSGSPAHKVRQNDSRRRKHPRSAQRRSSRLAWPPSISSAASRWWL